MKKNLILLLSICLTAYLANAQGFYFDIKDSISNDFPNFIVTDIDGNYIISISAEHSKLIKVSQSGEIVLEKDLYPDKTYSIKSIVNDGDDFVGVGYIKQDSINFDLLIIKFDNMFNVISERIYVTNKIYIPKKIIKDIDNNYVAVGNYIMNYDDFPLIVKFNSNLDSIRFVELPDSIYGWYWDIKENKNKTGYLVLTEAQIIQSGNCELKLAEYNHNLYMDTVYCYNPSNVYSSGWKNQFEFYKNKSIIIGGLFVYPTSTYQDEASMFLKLDTNYNITKWKKFGSVDTSEYPAFIRSFAITADNYIYNCATSNIYNMNYYPFQQQPSWILLNKVDSNFNIVWKKYYGGDAYYNPFDIIATPDGGCIITGFRYDHLTQNQETDVFVLKVDNNGLITNIKENQGIKSYNAILYPNPATTIINIRVVENYQNSKISISDISGKQIMFEQIEGTAKQLNIANLKPGVYLYNIINNSEIVERGKFVKEL